jgi:hypothetical protein
VDDGGRHVDPRNGRGAVVMTQFPIGSAVFDWWLDSPCTVLRHGRDVAGFIWTEVEYPDGARDKVYREYLRSAYHPDFVVVATGSAKGRGR